MRDGGNLVLISRQSTPNAVASDCPQVKNAICPIGSFLRMFVFEQARLGSGQIFFVAHSYLPRNQHIAGL